MFFPPSVLSDLRLAFPKAQPPVCRAAGELGSIMCSIPPAFTPWGCLSALFCPLHRIEIKIQSKIIQRSKVGAESQASCSSTVPHRSSGQSWERRLSEAQRSRAMLCDMDSPSRSFGVEWCHSLAVGRCLSRRIMD